MFKLIAVTICVLGLQASVNAAPTCEESPGGLGCLIKLTTFVKILDNGNLDRTGNVTFIAYTKRNRWTHIGGSLQ